MLSVQKKYNKRSKWGAGERRQDCLFTVRFHGPQINSDTKWDVNTNTKHM